MITLPEKFANDIQSKDTFLTTLIILNDQDEDESKRMYLSTGKVTLDGFHYDPFIKSLLIVEDSEKFNLHPSVWKAIRFAGVLI